MVDLPLFEPAACCIKCGSRAWARFNEMRGIMQRTCKVCEHQWAERPLDQATDLEVADRARTAFYEGSALNHMRR